MTSSQGTRGRRRLLVVGAATAATAGVVTIMSPTAVLPQVTAFTTTTGFSNPGRKLSSYSTRLAPKATVAWLRRDKLSLSKSDHDGSEGMGVVINDGSWSWDELNRSVRGFAVTAGVAASLMFSSLTFAPSAGYAENELSAKYGGGLDTSLVDQSCLVNKCSIQANACLRDDPSCRKGLTCTAKCLGDNACITGCMARYGNANLDNLLKCTIEDNECIKVAILDGGADAYGAEPRSIAPTVPNFDPQSLQGSWYKVVGYNPNYDCYACQRNSFSGPRSSPSSDGKNDGAPTFISNNNPLAKSRSNAQLSSTNMDPMTLEMDVEFSMPHLMPDGSPAPPSKIKEQILLNNEDGTAFGSKSIGLNDYHTHETMVFDNPASLPDGKQTLVLNKGTISEASYARTAHSEGEMFGLKFWENWYIIGENDPGAPEFKFVYYNGKTRQNTYEGAFVYSRTKDLSPESMKKVYQIASNAGMNTNQFCKIRNGCFNDGGEVSSNRVPERTGLGSPSNPFRGILASTKVSELLGVEPVAARDTVRKDTPTAMVLKPGEMYEAGNDGEVVGASVKRGSRGWWHEVGDYLENPHRHFRAMDELRVPIEWPDDVKQQQN